MTTQNSTRLDMLTKQLNILSDKEHQREMDDSRSIQRLNDRIGELERKQDNHDAELDRLDRRITNLSSDRVYQLEQKLPFEIGLLEDKVRDLENKLSDLERR